MDKTTGATPSQQTLERMLPGRGQSISEQVLGNNRDEKKCCVSNGRIKLYYAWCQR